jgi:hypothetical protein
MHFIIRATIPVSAGNKLVRTNLQDTMDKLLGDVRPDAVYFAIEKGQRTLYLIASAEKGAEMIRLAEPLWLSLEADVDVIPAMDAADFAEAGPTLGQLVAKY